MSDLYLKKIYFLEGTHLKNAKKTKNKDYFYPKFKTNYEKNYYEQKIILPAYQNFFTYIKNNSLFFTNDTIKTLTNLFHRILYYEEEQEKDYKFMYQEFLNIVDNCTSSFYENILDCLKHLLNQNPNLSLEPFIKELENTSKHFNNHYLNDRIKILIYKFTINLKDCLSDNDLNRLENLLLKACTSKDTPNNLKSYNSALSNYLYCLNINNSNYLEHKKIVLSENNTEIINAFEQDIISKNPTRKRQNN